MPKKRSTAGSTEPAPPSVSTPSRPRRSLLERLRAERAQGFHTPERARLMTSELGQQAYVEARQELPLPERILLFERIVEEALQAHRHQNLALHLHGNEHDAVERAHHRELLTALVPEWEKAVEAIEGLLPDAEDERVARALQTAAKQVRGMTRSGRDGNAGWTVQGWIVRMTESGSSATYRLEPLVTPEATQEKEQGSWTY